MEKVNPTVGNCRVRFTFGHVLYQVGYIEQKCTLKIDCVQVRIALLHCVSKILHSWEENVLKVKENESRWECLCVLVGLEEFVRNCVRRRSNLSQIMTNSNCILKNPLCYAYLVPE